MRRSIGIIALALSLTVVPSLRAQGLKELGVFTGHAYTVRTVALSPDGKMLASAGGSGNRGELFVWDLTAWKLAADLPVRGGVNAVAFSADGKQLVAGGAAGQVTLWDLASREERRTFAGRVGFHVQWVAISADGRKVAAVGDLDVKLWDAATGRELAGFQRVVRGSRVAFSPDLQLAATPNYQEIDLWDVTTGKQRAVLSEHRGQVRCLAFRRDARTLVADSVWSTDDHRAFGEVKVWDVATGRERSKLKGDFGNVDDLIVSPDGKTLALWGRDIDARTTRLQFLDLATSRMLLSHEVKDRAFASLHWAAGRSPLLTNVRGDEVRLWEITLR